MKCTVPCSFSSLIFVIIFIAWGESKKETIIEVPKNNIWSWTDLKWTSTFGNDGKILYPACDVSSPSEPNRWIRSNEFLAGDAKRIDVTVKYSVSKCSSVSLQYCKEKLNLYVYKAAIKHGANKVPEPWQNLALYNIFGSTSPKILTSGALSRNGANNETHSFLTNSTTPYYYIAIQYQGGCFEIYGVTISYSFCASLALPTGLIQLPRTIAPVNGTVKVSGSCAENSQPPANNVSLYGICGANGEWSSQAIGGGCWCKASYGKYLNGSGAVCKKCPSGTYQDIPSGSACKLCPLNTVQDVNRKKCNCAPSFYRTKDETISDNCTAQPSAPQDIKALSISAASVDIEWAIPSNLGGRSDVYYEVECKKCNEEGKECNGKCSGTKIIHSPKDSRKATIKDLSAYTFYQFKVSAKNAVSTLAGRNGEAPKFVVLKKRTSESLPGAPVQVAVEVLGSTSVLLSWTLLEKHGVITYYQASYYPVGQKSEIKFANTTKRSITIHGLEKGKKYFFQVRASTSVGLGPPGNISQTVAQRSTNNKGALSQDQLIGVIGGVIAIIVLLIIIIILVCIHRKKQKRRTDSKLHLANAEFIPLDGHRMYIDPSTYGSPMEALMSNTVEINSRDLKLDKNIGGGEFADVYKGTLSKDSTSEIVAVKILKPRSSLKNKEDFILEASIMGQFKHPNVIELKGVVTRSPDHPMMIVTEFMENGSLDHYLKTRDGQLSVLQQVGICRGVASGMAYLSGMNFIHRDLAARNILVADNMASKISDFGLSRELDTEDNPDSEYQTQGGKIPVRWTAPEAIRYKKFSSASDVWSYGILVWEIMSYGERPYWDWDNYQVMDRVEQGYRLPAPMNCPKTIHNIMLDCWEKDKNSRPKFPDIVQKFDELIRSPEKISDQPASRFSVNGETNFGEMTSVEDWLTQIKMDKYTDNFKQAGYVSLDQIKSLEEDDLKGMGIRLAGHLNKMRKSIKAMQSHYENEA